MMGQKVKEKGEVFFPFHKKYNTNNCHCHCHFTKFLDFILGFSLAAAAISMGKFRNAIAAVKDHTSIRLAKRSSLSDLDVAIVKATCHEEYPADEQNIQEILNLTCDSPVYVASCVNTISRRLNKTKNWVVALKALMLVRRLLHDGHPVYEQEFFFATRRGTRLLNMSDFRDTLRSSTWDYAAFVRTYALFLDKQLEYRMQGRRGRHGSSSHEEDDDHTGPQAIVVVPVQEMNNDQMFSRIHHLMQVLERFLACRPTGEARVHRMVLAALYPIVEQSFQLYYSITETMGVLMDRFEELSVSPHSAKVYDIFRRAAMYYDELDMFYRWCKSVGIAKTSEYPEVDKVSQRKLHDMVESMKEKSTGAKQG